MEREPPPRALGGGLTPRGPAPLPPLLGYLRRPAWGCTLCRRSAPIGGAETETKETPMSSSTPSSGSAGLPASVRGDSPAERATAAAVAIQDLLPELDALPLIRYRVFFQAPSREIPSSVTVMEGSAWVAAWKAGLTFGAVVSRVELASEPGEVVWERPGETLIADPIVKLDESTGCWQVRTAYFDSLLAVFAGGREAEARFYASTYTVSRPSVPARASRKYHAVDVEADVEGLAADIDGIRNTISELQSSELCRRTSEAGEAVEAAIAYLQTAADNLAKCRIALGGEPRYGERSDGSHDGRVDRPAINYDRPGGVDR